MVLCVAVLVLVDEAGGPRGGGGGGRDLGSFVLCVLLLVDEGGGSGGNGLEYGSSSGRLNRFSK